MKRLPPEDAAALRDEYRPHIAVGDRVRFVGDRLWWDVRCLTGQHVVLTRQVQFQPRGTLSYTVIDWELGFRGPCNQIGQGWGDGTYSDDECAALLHAFTLGDNEPEGVEVSWRNRVPVQIATVKRTWGDR